MPKEIPLLYRHDRPAGRVLEAITTEQGLYVKAVLTDSEAKRCLHFSVAATIRDYRIMHADDAKRAYALVTHAVLDEVSIVRSPAQPEAKILIRDRAVPPALVDYDVTKAAVTKAMQVVELRALNNAAPEQPARAPKHPNTRAPLPRVRATSSPPRVSVEPHRTTAFGKFITEMERVHHAS